MPQSSTLSTTKPSTIDGHADVVAIRAGDGVADERRSAQALARAERAAVRAAARAVPPEIDDTYAHLSLAEMRRHRQDVTEAAERVGYWLRVAAQRLDAMRGLGADLDVFKMNAELATKRLEDTRSGLVHTARRPLPALPVLAPLWADVTERGADRRLEKAIDGLERYHAALSFLSRAATAEVIARYRQTPSDCLAILPA